MSRPTGARACSWRSPRFRRNGTARSWPASPSAISSDGIGEGVPAISGLPATTSEDDLKALGAAAASSGAVALFHAIGLTPEAPTFDAAFGGHAPERVVRFDADDLRAAARSLSDGRGWRAARRRHARHAAFLDRRVRAPDAAAATATPPVVEIWVNTSRATLASAARARLGGDAARRRRHAGRRHLRLRQRSCCRSREGAVMTNSGKCAYYAPGNLGVGVAFGSLAECVASARAGRVVRL